MVCLSCTKYYSIQLTTGWPQGEDKRTGKSRTSTEGPVVDAQGRNAIYLSDIAAATIDEAEENRFK